MPFDAQLVASLLFEGESTHLDFKSSQYPFAEATDGQKAELLKDILAFANSWRQTDAYILIGVEEVTAGRAVVVGVDHHLDDAALQQFVNSKTQRTVEFSYSSMPLDAKEVGVLWIPVQTRPTFLTRRFSQLSANAVYVRQGSSTAIASPDEIKAMGEAESSADGRDGSLRRRASKLALPRHLLALSDDALALIVDAPLAWEYKLFVQRLREELQPRRHLRLELDVALPQSASVAMSDEELAGWQRTKWSTLDALTQSFGRLLNQAAKEAFGELGVSGDPAAIDSVARKLAELYERALAWGIEYRAYAVEEAAERLMELSARACLIIADAVEEVPERFAAEIARVEALPPGERDTEHEKVLITLADPYSDELSHEIQALGQRIRGGT